MKTSTSAGLQTGTVSPWVTKMTLWPSSIQGHIRYVPRNSLSLRSMKSAGTMQVTCFSSQVVPAVFTFWGKLMILCCKLWKELYLTYFLLMQVLVQVMDCHLLSMKPLAEPVKAHSQLDPQELTTIKFKSKYKNHPSIKYIWKCCLHNDSHFVQASLCYWL